MMPKGKITKSTELAAVGLGQCSLDEIAVVSDFPKEDSKSEAEELLTQGGGPVATALVTLARLGVPAHFMGIIGDDDAGKTIKKGLISEGISIKGLVTRKDATSQRACIIVNTDNGSRTVIWQRASATPMAPAEIRTPLIKKASILLLDGLMEDASQAAAELAKDSGVPVLLDAGSMRPGMLELAKTSDYIVTSESFARAVASSPDKALKELRTLNPQAKAITITLGKEGSITCAKDKRIFRDAYKINTIDTTGAGDVFHGGFAYAIINGWPIEKTIEFASAMAALKCQQPGGRTGIPTLKEALKLTEDQAI